MQAIDRWHRKKYMRLRIRLDSANSKSERDRLRRIMRTMRLDEEYAEEPDGWMTTEAGLHVPLDDDGNAIGTVLEGENFSGADTESSKSAKSKVSLRSLSTRLSELGKNWSDPSEVRDVLKDVPDGSYITCTAGNGTMTYQKINSGYYEAEGESRGTATASEMARLLSHKSEITIAEGEVPERETAAQVLNDNWLEEISRQREEHLGMKDSKKALTLVDKYGDSDEMYDKVLQAFQAKDGSLDKMVNDYYDIMEENGDPTPSKEVSDQGTSDSISEDVRSGKYRSYEEARLARIREYTGYDDETAQKTLGELQTWFSNSWSDADTDTLDAYVDADHVQAGTIYRGLLMESAEYEDFMSVAREAGSIISSQFQMNQSWTTSKETAQRYSSSRGTEGDSVMLVCVANKTSSPVSYISHQGGECEVLSHSRAQWTVLATEEHENTYGQKRAIVYVAEKEQRL